MTDVPSRADLLTAGGIYPVVVPLGWKLIGKEGADVGIPAVPGDPFHRITAKGALLATEAVRSDQPEVMTVRPFGSSDLFTSQGLDRYVEAVMVTLGERGLEPRLDEKRIGTCALGTGPCVKVVVSRMSPTESRMEIHYLTQDQRDQSWEIVYLVRRAEIERWRLLLAEIEGHR